MRQRSRFAILTALSAALLLVSAACGSDDEADDDSSAAETTTTEAPADESSTTEVDIYLVDSDAFAEGTEPYVVAVPRDVDAEDPIAGAVDALFDGPDADDEGLELVASDATGADVLSVEDGVARVQLVGGCDSGGSTMTIAQQLLPTLQQFDEVDVVKLLDPDGTTADEASDMDSTPECLEP